MAGPRPVGFDATGVREAYAAAGDDLVVLAEQVSADAWDDPALGDWTVRDLLGHTTRSFVTVTDYLVSGAGRTVELGHPFDYAAVFAMAHADPAAITERGRAAGRELGDAPVEEVRRRRDAALAAVAGHPDDAPVDTPAGVMRLADYLPTRVFELVVHGDDLARAIGVEPPADVAARTVATTFASGLAAEASGAWSVLRALTGRGGLAAGFTVL
ncbi:maleylpyruvate isomerase family mycothiol-dependent enzyme [Nocardioides sp. GXQ0305]|uniref:maleylpyruvate isomerase family mycothiol-dependent enzyme n=1 Tax=Nocardioides sp. GXQ0305 TaxID=3423912 RepID=UPI003D7D0CA6